MAFEQYKNITNIVDYLNATKRPSDFSARRTLWAKYGNTSTFTGSASQNNWLLDRVKKDDATSSPANWGQSIANIADIANQAAAKAKADALKQQQIIKNAVTPQKEVQKLNELWLTEKIDKESKDPFIIRMNSIYALYAIECNFMIGNTKLMNEDTLAEVQIRFADKLNEIYREYIESIDYVGLRNKAMVAKNYTLVNRLQDLEDQDQRWLAAYLEKGGIQGLSGLPVSILKTVWNKIPVRFKNMLKILAAGLTGYVIDDLVQSTFKLNKEAIAEHNAEVIKAKEIAIQEQQKQINKLQEEPKNEEEEILRYKIVSGVFGMTKEDYKKQLFTDAQKKALCKVYTAQGILKEDLFNKGFSKAELIEIAKDYSSKYPVNNYARNSLDPELRRIAREGIYYFEPYDPKKVVEKFTEKQTGILDKIFGDTGLPIWVQWLLFGVGAIAIVPGGIALVNNLLKKKGE